MSRKSALVIAPGRGTYNKEELGYLARHHGDKPDLIAGFDALRRTSGETPVSELDGATSYSAARFTRGDNASALIYSCAYADYMSIDQKQFDIVGVAGNSMGWYIAMACAGVLTANAGFELVNTTGRLMHDSMIGGQILYPVVDENWIEIPGRRAALMQLIEQTDGLYLSIDLGGMIVFAGTETALETATARLEPLQGRFPMRLKNHAGFHAPLQQPVAEQAQKALAHLPRRQPQSTLIDGRGVLWQPPLCDLTALWRYTLGPQIVTPYDFTRALQNALHELAPDVIIVLGPGSTLGGAVAQTLIADSWHGLAHKSDFSACQATDPLILSMGLKEQRDIVTGGTSCQS
jgi:[acyl-carrier-protein] S-malonyltransferase